MTTFKLNQQRHHQQRLYPISHQPPFHGKPSWHHNT